MKMGFNSNCIEVWVIFLNVLSVAIKLGLVKYPEE